MCLIYHLTRNLYYDLEPVFLGMSLSTESVVVAIKSQVSCQLGAETVILHFDKGLYFGLNEVGTLVWNLIQQPRRVREIQDAILREYQVSTEQCEQDLFMLLARLSAKGLIEVRDETAPKILHQHAAI